MVFTTWKLTNRAFVPYNSKWMGILGKPNESFYLSPSDILYKVVVRTEHPSGMIRQSIYRRGRYCWQA
jgi:hypothetical protein